MKPLPHKPLISVVVPSFNQGRFIRDTIDSCLRQDYRPLEIIVMDGGSKDETVEVLKSYGDCPELRWVSEPDKGVADAVNKGMALARGDICAIQSSDDAYVPGAFAAAVASFRAYPDAALVYADTIKVNGEGAELSRFRTGPFSITNFLSKRTVVLQPAAFFRREAFEAVGGWSLDYFNADTECWLRMITRYPALKVDAFWSTRRMHEAQRDKNGAKILSDYRRMMEEHATIKRGPSYWRRAAACGVLRHSMRYGPGLGADEKRRLLWRAVRTWPPVLLDAEVAGLVCPWYLGIRRRFMRLTGRTA